MSTPEQNFWKLIKKYLPGDVSRIENIADNGTPDVSGAYKGVDYWVELKVCNNLKKVKDPLDLLGNNQKIWHMKRNQQGSLIFVFIYYPNMRPKRINYYVLYDNEYYFMDISKSIGAHIDWLDFNNNIKNWIEKKKKRINKKWSM